MLSDIHTQAICRINPGDVNDDIHQPPAPLKEQLEKLGEQGEQAAQDDGDAVVFDGLIHEQKQDTE